MNACDFSVWEKFDLGACAHSLAFGWVPDWVWPLLPYWPVAAIILGAAISWKMAGTPGLGIFAGVVGFILGRMSVTPEPHEHVSGKDAAVPQREKLPKKKVRTIFDR
jgi:hypothetical protein